MCSSDLAAEHFFPGFGALGGGAGFEREVTRAGGAAVAPEAVFVDELTLGRLRLQGGGEERSQAKRGPEHGTAHPSDYTGNGVAYRG